ncbi:transposase [Azospirillum melinis]|uniref:Transposase n=1 Tax=Azospirillum melinis TaxID=328839 RepID=A0ABX2KES9_9PROT|nr:hypothetical protein [Azospirillum melinis]NUB02087.1 transposase [Azospirillum melinis]
MARRKRHTPEQIISMLRAIEVAVAQGRTVAETCREHAISEQTYYRWRAEFGGLKLAFCRTRWPPSCRGSGRRNLPVRARQGGGGATTCL